MACAANPAYLPHSSSPSKLDSDFDCCYTWFARDHSGDCEMQINVSKYVVEYGLNGQNMSSSTFGGKPLEPPILNISAPFLEKIPENPEREIEQRYSASQSIHDKSFVLWEYYNQTYNLDYLTQHGRCQAVLDYKRGFSYIQLFIMIILNIFWTLGLHTMWLRAYMTMRKQERANEDVTGEHKAIFELAAAMRAQMDQFVKEEGDDVSTLTEAKLRRRITKNPRGGSIPYTTPLLPNGESGNEWDTKVWIKNHKLSILAMAVCVATAFLPPGIISLLTLPFHLSIALYVGSNRQSRIVLFVWTFLVTPLWCISPYR